MEIIDKTHVDITRRTRHNYEKYIKFVNSKEIYISAGAAIEYGLSDGLYLHLIHDDDRWYIYFDTNEDGFALKTRRGDKQHIRSIDIFNTALVRVFISRTSHNIPCKFELKLLESKHNGNHLIEIMHHKPLIS